MNNQPQSAYGQAKAARKEQRKTREAAYKEALRRYSDDRIAAREQGTKLPNMADYMPKFDF